MSLLRTRWAAVGAAVAVTLGAGGVAMVDATVTSGTRTVFVPITPCRLMDTRPNTTVGPRSAPLASADTYTVDAHGTNGECSGIPTGAVGLSLNVTAIGATLPTFLTVWSADDAQPEASSLNPVPGQPPTPNAVTTELSSLGRFKMYNLQGNVNVLVDVNGYYEHHSHDDRYYRKSQVDDRIAAAWAPVPSGTTITGMHTFDIQSPAGGGDYSVTIPLRGVPPEAVISTQVNFNVDGLDATTDDDPSCTGSKDVPTAPPGKVCLYVWSLTNMNNASANAPAIPGSFSVFWFSTGAGDMYITFSYAYTAP